MSTHPRIAVVTGASRGIGRACALQLAHAGADVAVISFGDADDLEGVSREIIDLGRRSLAIDIDVSDYRGAHQSVERIGQELGPVSILVNNAGMSQPLRILELTEADWDRTMTVNLKSVFNWTQAVLPSMFDTGWGRIINISSISAKSGGGGPPKSVSRSAYAASKAGILGFTRSLALEVAPDVTVNAVCPGPIQTKLTESIMSGAAGEARAREIPLKRLGQPDDVASVVSFLASDAASFITGEVIDVAGGSYID
jgi:3-oxoacyl-[acyl-carrier protein] reductase